MDVYVKFGDSRSNGFRDIRGADFMSNEQDETYLDHRSVIPVARNAFQAFHLKMKDPNFESMAFCRMIQTFCEITLPRVATKRFETCFE